MKLGVILAGIATVGAVTFGAVTLPAHAGSSGQQLALYNPYANVSYVCINGDNQYWQDTSQCIQVSQNAWTYDYNWWWQGQVTVYYFSPQGYHVNTSTVNVPSSQSGSDWLTAILTE